MRHREARSMQVVGTCFILIRIKGRGIATCKWQTTVRLYTKGFLKMQWQTQQLQSVVAIHLWRGDYPRIKLLLCKNDMSRLYILNSSLFLGKKTKVGLEKKSFSLFFHTFILNRYFNKMTKSSKQISKY